MKIRVAYTLNVSDDYRRAINQYYGDDGLASRDTVRSWARIHGSSMDDDIMHDMREDDE